jgi:hypothetical protein
MVYPVGNPYGQQQIPASNTFQPGGTESVKRPEENKTQDSTRPSGTDAARTERVTNRDASTTTRTADTDSDRDNGAVYSSSSRGTNLDITA